jgi:hypothetical protein
MNAIQKNLFLCAIFLFVPCCLGDQLVQQSVEPITLKFASFIDGTFIKWSTLVEVVHPFMQRLHECVYGALNAQKQHVGHYACGGKLYSIKELSELEISNKFPSAKEYQVAFKQAKHELVGLAQEFFGKADSKAKAMIVLLVKESCTKRERTDSALYIWSRAKGNQENELFEQLIPDFASLYTFCLDLNVFLHDFVHSCPKARQQLHDQLEKWNKIKTILPGTLEKVGVVFDEATYVKFMRWVEWDILPELHIDKITPDFLKELILTFNGNRK